MRENKTGLLDWLAAWLVLLVGLLGGGSALAETITYFHNDIAGTPIAASDAAGNVIWKENYQPFGGRMNNLPASGSNDQWFAGKPVETATGLSYFGARYYDPALGRFMGIDPKEVDPNNLHSFNRYSYGNNNPYRYKDPDGRQNEPLNEVEEERERINRTFVYPGASAARTTGEIMAGPVSDAAQAGYETYVGAKAIKAIGIVVGSTLKSANGARNLTLPTLDRTGKVHGEIPSSIPKGATKDELRELASDLRKSIQTRKIEQFRLGEHGPHRERIRQEEQFLRQIDKHLSGS